MILIKTLRLKAISVWVPYVSVLIGLYGFHHAWLAIGLYHLGMAVWVVSNRRDLPVKTVCSGWHSVAAA